MRKCFEPRSGPPRPECRRRHHQRPQSARPRAPPVRLLPGLPRASSGDRRRHRRPPRSCRRSPAFSLSTLSLISLSLLLSWSSTPAPWMPSSRAHLGGSNAATGPPPARSGASLPDPRALHLLYPIRRCPPQLLLSSVRPSSSLCVAREGSRSLLDQSHHVAFSVDLAVPSALPSTSTDVHLIVPCYTIY